MKSYKLVLVFFLFSCTKTVVSPNTLTTSSTSVYNTSDASFTYKTILFDFTNNYPSMPDSSNVQTGGLSSAIINPNSSINYNVNGVENMIITPHSIYHTPLIHLINSDSVWKIENVYNTPLSNFSEPNYSEVDNNGNLSIAESGSEAVGQNNMIGGSTIYTQTNSDNSLKFSNASGTNRYIFWSTAIGDLNNDGKNDIVSVCNSCNLINKNNDWLGVMGEMFPYTQNSNGTFLINQNLISDPLLDKSWKYPIDGQQKIGIIGISNITGDNKPEIIFAGRYGFLFFTWDNTIQKYKLANTNIDAGFFNSQRSPIEIKFADFDKDGNTDVAIEFEGPPGGGIQIWFNDGMGNLTAGPQYFFNNTVIANRFFEVGDINGDGYPDIFIDGNTPSTPFNLKDCMWLNNKNKTFSFSTKDFWVSQKSSEMPQMIKGFFSNGKFKVIGTRGMFDDLGNVGRTQFKIIDISNFKW